MEGGTSINQSFYPNENVSGLIYPYYFCGTGQKMEAIGYYNSEIFRKTTFSSYTRIGIERETNDRKHFNMSFPFIFSHKEQQENTETQVEEVLYNSGTKKHMIKTQTEARFASFIFGPKATCNFEPITFFTALYFNADINYYYKEVVSNNNVEIRNPGIEGLTMNEDVLFNLSLHNGVLFNLNSKFALGLTADILFYNINPSAIKYSKKDNHLFNLGYGTNSTIINTGIRLQYSF